MSTKTKPEDYIPDVFHFAFCVDLKKVMPKSLLQLALLRWFQHS